MIVICDIYGAFCRMELTDGFAILLTYAALKQRHSHNIPENCLAPSVPFW